MAEAVGGFTGALQGSIGGLLNVGQGYLDRFFPPEKRSELSAKISKFATEKPLFASFLLSQIALSGIPLALFAVMTIGVAVFAIVGALVVAVLAAALFIVFCVGVALIVLLPTLFMTSCAGAFVWLWGLGAYYILKWFNKKEIPGVHKPMPSGGVKDLMGMNGDGKAVPKGEETDGGEGGGGDGGGEKQSNGVLGGKADGVGKATGIDGAGLDGLKKKADLGNVTKNADLGNVSKAANVGNVKGTLGGVAGGVL
ncbi:hypothetical protein MMC20_002720 [Loxospora ochrophaea]|nr:hypothetical protein [Loxospora ochrophaea]